MSEKQNIDGMQVAKAVKYWLHLENPYATVEVPMNCIQAKSLYTQHSKTFENAAMIFNKYNIDPLAYSKFFVQKFGKKSKDIDDCYLSPQTFNFFVEDMKASEEKKKIYKNFIKSAEFIVKESIALGFPSMKDWLRYAICEKKLANYYVAGKISKYFFASIPNFPKILPKLDQFARDELSIIAERFDKYNTDINEAFLYMKKCKINPVDFIDTLIASRST